MKNWPATAVELRSVGDLVPYGRNARKHPEAQVQQIARSIQEFGWTIPVLIDEKGELIAGHGRVMAAQLLGIEQVPAMTARGWTKEQKRAYALADNQLTINSEWDQGLLKLELTELAEVGFDLSIIGFSDGDWLETLPSGGKASGVLAEEFGVPPFTVLNARDGWWQNRKKAWIGLGIKSEIGRGE